MKCATEYNVSRYQEVYGGTSYLGMEQVQMGRPYIHKE